jgi:uncharacterized membrane protein YkoI
MKKTLFLLFLSSFFAIQTAHASVNRDTAEEIALKQVPGGNIVGGGLEKANGRLVWTLELAVPTSRNVHEVVIDADSGKVLSVRIETPAEQVGKTQPL